MPDEPEPIRRVVALGASNLTRGLATLVDLAVGVWGDGIDILCALGHGRSYGQRSRVLWRELPGILQCGLWPALERLGRAPTLGLITDVGNDILYGAPVATILDWVDECAIRLSRSGSRVVISGLPLATLRGLPEWKYTLVRSVLFPASRLGLAGAQERAERLDAGLRTIATTHGCAFVAPRADWYGLDPIHTRPRARGEAWGELVLGAERRPPPKERPGPGHNLRWQWRSLRPEQRWLFGQEQRRPQPARRLPGATQLWLF
jgi:hypothetical protein